MPRAEQLTEVVTVHGEGPVFSADWGGLRFVDMLAGAVLTLADDHSVSRRQLGSVAAALRPRSRGGFVVALERGFALDDGTGAPLQVLPEVWQDDTVRMNEGGCDPDGRFYCGSMAYAETPGAGTLYRLDPDGTVSPVLRAVTISNGLEWSPDGSIAYYNDTPSQQISVFDYDTERGLHGRRPWVHIDPADGSPDGLTVDATGAVWVALFGGSAVRRYLPDGSLDAVIELPVSQVTACTFGGPELADLFITTSREGLTAEDEPLAGALFGFRPGVSGRPVRTFAG